MRFSPAVTLLRRSLRHRDRQSPAPPADLSEDMPSKSLSKRSLEELVNADDSDDVDYDDRAAGPGRRAKRIKTSGRQTKKRRRGYGSGSDDEITDDNGEVSADESLEASSAESEEPETNEKGRPVRRAVKARGKYEEPPSEDEDLNESPSEDEEEEEDEDLRPSPRAKKRSLIVKLPVASPMKPTRSLRNRSGSFGGKTVPPAAESARGTRRSSRHLGDEEETLIALTDSGRHAQVARQGTRSPEGVPRRAMKGVKYPSKSTIDEESGESNGVHLHDPALEEPEIEASQDAAAGEPVPEVIPRIMSDIHDAAQEGTDVEMEEDAYIAESQQEEQAEDDDEDEGPIARKRKTRSSDMKNDTADETDEGTRAGGRSLRRSLRERKPAEPSRRRKGVDESSDFEPVPEEAEASMSESDHSSETRKKGSQRRNDNDDSSNGRRSGRMTRKRSARQSPESEIDEQELAEELAEIRPDRRSRRKEREDVVISYEPRRRGKRPDYRLLRPELNLPIEDLEEEPAPTPTRRKGGGGGGGWQRSFLPTAGPFGGAGGPAPVLGGLGSYGAAAGADSDSSDDEVMQRPKPLGGMTGMTPTTAGNPGAFNLFPGAQTHGSDPVQGPAGTPANLGKIKDKQALADADPLGVPQDVSFESVGGLEGHIDQLKEMVALPLLYPEIFQRFHIVPPRGVLFHGPPGTGKTLLARALASSVSSEGKKVTFYMRKGADALSKWVGEAERQLRLLFEEARKNQPSIIFFDEIDGLAPVRSSKQEQIHASIVSTLLALMDGMDGRGQVIVIGATNRPDSIDPALRRPGRFDREFYFPLPGTQARRGILDIHTKEWDPPLDPTIKDELAELTKGYGGADLRALCTEAALNAVQRKYPQIYRSNIKLLIDPKKIEVTPKDFMISVKKMVPSSERSASSGASPLPAIVEPLLRAPLKEIKNIVAEILPQKKQLTALEEAQFEEPTNDSGFRRERMQQNFETSRVFRPRLLVRGASGMGQQYLASALLNHFEGLHVQSFDLPTLLSDSTRSQEAAIVQLFTEVKLHKPSVIYIPNVLTWYSTVGQTVINTFIGMLRSLKPTDPVLVLGILESDSGEDDVESELIRGLFGFSKRNRFEIQKPDRDARREFFTTVIEYIRVAPSDFPDPANRKKRKPEILPPAPREKTPEAPALSKEELKAQKKRDRHTLNLLKIRLQPIMDQIRTKYRKFRTGVIDESQIRYLYEEENPAVVTSDLPIERRIVASFRPYEKDTDPQGEPVLRETGSGKLFYNIDSVTIEKRLSNGYYKRPKDFLADIKRLAKDAKAIGDQERILKANELLANVEVDIGGIEMGEPALAAECEKVYSREQKREEEAIEKARKAAEAEGRMPPPMTSNVPHNDSEPTSLNPSTGAIQLGESLPNGRPEVEIGPDTPSRPSKSTSVLTNGHTAIPMTTGGGSDLNASSEQATHGSNEDVHMEGTEAHPNSKSNSADRSTQQSSFGQTSSAQPRPVHSMTAPSQAVREASGMYGPRTQESTVTPLAPGSQPGDYTNEASTTQTTSDKKSSGQNNTQGSGDSNLRNAPQPDFSNFQERSDPDIPDTQDTKPNSGHPGASQGSQTENADVVFHLPSSQSTGPSSGSQVASRPPQPHSQHSQPPPVPQFDGATAQRQRSNPSDIASLLNDTEPPLSEHNAVAVSHANSNPQLIVDYAKINNLHEYITHQTSGCTVEQLEQVNTMLMDTVWKLRGEWDRSRVTEEMRAAFEDVLQDVKHIQGIGEGSWEGQTQMPGQTV